MIKQLYERPRNLKTKGKRWKLLYKFNKLLAVTLVPIINGAQSFKGTDPDNGKIIVSLTTFPDRIDKVWITITTLMNQTKKAKRIILWLSKEQFPNEEEGLPAKLLKLKARGLEIKFCPKDIRSHKKYYHTLQENPNDYIVTADDDMLYPENLLEQLWNAHLENPEAIVCEYAHLITVDDTDVKPYAEWISSYEKGNTPLVRLLPVGCGGVMYPPHFLDENVLNLDELLKLCPKMDDLWLKCMALKKGKAAVTVGEGSLIYFDIPGTRKSGLYHTNVEGNDDRETNDYALHSIFEQYPELKTIIVNNKFD